MWRCVYAQVPADQSMLTLFGVAAASTMVVSYALESRGTKWIAIFAGGCAATAIYGVATNAWIFAILETVWAGIAVRRFVLAKRI